NIRWSTRFVQIVVICRGAWHRLSRFTRWAGKNSAQSICLAKVRRAVGIPVHLLGQRIPVPSAGSPPGGGGVIDISGLCPVGDDENPCQTTLDFILSRAFGGIQVADSPVVAGAVVPVRRAKNRAGLGPAARQHRISRALVCQQTELVGVRPAVACAV